MRSGMVNGVSHAELDFPSTCTKAPAGFVVKRISTLPVAGAFSGMCSVAAFLTGTAAGIFSAIDVAVAGWVCALGAVEVAVAEGRDCVSTWPAVPAGEGWAV